MFVCRISVAQIDLLYELIYGEAHFLVLGDQVRFVLNFFFHVRPGSQTGMRANSAL